MAESIETIYARRIGMAVAILASEYFIDASYGAKYDIICVHAREGWQLVDIIDLIREYHRPYSGND